MAHRAIRSDAKGSAPQTSPPPSASSKSAEGQDAAEPSRPQDLLATRCPFDPTFFLTQLGVFVRDRCPDPAEGLPAVEIHLADGEVLNVCHVIGLAPRWLAVAVDDREFAGVAAMRTEVVAYEHIARVTVRSLPPSSDRVGFSLGVPQSVA